MGNDKKKVILLAILSRILLVSVQFFANYLPDHDADVFVSPTSQTRNSTVCNQLIDTVFGGFRRWDAEYFLHIAEHGYTYENTLVFYPLFPFCVRFATYTVQSILPIQCRFHELSLLVAIMLNIIFFVRAAITLYELTIHQFDNKRYARITIVLFCLNPASIFFTAPYTESLFCWLTFSVILNCAKKCFRRASLYLILGLWCRSNGIINFGFVLYHLIQHLFNSKRKFVDYVMCISKATFYLLITTLAFGLVQIYYYLLYCTDYQVKTDRSVRTYAENNNFVMIGQRSSEIVWCSFSIPYSYSYLQHHYWNVGLFNYYELKQIPNFILAMPILAFILFDSMKFLLRHPKIILQLGLINRNDNSKHFVYVVHAFALSIFCLLFVHIQVATRMLASSSPQIYWICAQYFYKENSQNYVKMLTNPKSRITTFIRNWFIGYYLIGTILFSNFLPWT